MIRTHTVILSFFFCTLPHRNVAFVGHIFFVTLREIDEWMLQNCSDGKNKLRGEKKKRRLCTIAHQKKERRNGTCIFHHEWKAAP